MSDDALTASVTLSPDEIEALACRLAGLKLADAAEWLDWEDVPLVDEDTFELILASVVEQGASMMRAMSAPGGPDAAEIHERVS